MKKSAFLNKKGAMSVLTIIIILSAVVVASGFITILERAHTINEVQGIMDTSGLIALRHGVNPERWRQEVIEINPQQAATTYRNLLSENIKPSERSALQWFSVDQVRIHEPHSANLRTLGIPDGERDQYHIESVVTLYFRNDATIRSPEAFSKTFFDFYYGTQGRYWTIGRQPGGTDEEVWVIRSVTRLVLR